MHDKKAVTKPSQNTILFFGAKKAAQTVFERLLAVFLQQREA
jgi:hypothetical protein